MKRQGFTLIELLVVIAIIGILSSVVLASLNSARGKGSNAAIKSGLANMRAQAELYYDGDGGSSYVGLCADTTFKRMLDSATSTAGAPGACEDDTNAWSASSQLKVAETGGGFWCVGSSGASKAVSANVSTSTSCQ